MDLLLAALLGLAGGVAGGLLGVGGGVLFVPALTIFLDEPQVRAEATSLLAVLPVAAAGAWRQRAYGNVDLRAGLAVGVLSLLGVAVGVIVANALSHRALELAFAALVLVVAAQLAIRALRPAPGGEEGSSDEADGTAGARRAGRG